MSFIPLYGRIKKGGGFFARRLFYCFILLCRNFRARVLAHITTEVFY